MLSPVDICIASRVIGRFFVFFAVFLLGMIVSSLAGTIETLFFGWELVGLSSALLVAYFHERPNPVRNGQRVWTVYRIADAAFLIAALALHHLTGGGDFEGLMGTGPWPRRRRRPISSIACAVRRIAAAGGGGRANRRLVPFSGWLPRAMEGPTPSSAIFYGALVGSPGCVSAAAGQSRFWSSRCCSVWRSSWSAWCRPFSAALTARVQTDIKSALAFASLTQVGIIVAEIGFGFRYIALDSHHRPRLLADAAIAASPDAAARLSHAGERDRFASAADGTVLATRDCRQAFGVGSIDLRWNAAILMRA